MDDQNYILFENYLSGSLTEDEIASFENKLKNNTAFNTEFTTYKELSVFLEHKFQRKEDSTAFRQNLKRISNSYFEKLETPKKSIKFKTWQYVIAASVVLFFGIQFFNSLVTPTYAKYANYDTISLTVRGSQNKLLTNAEEAFNSKNFVKAEVYFTQLLEADNNNSELKLYKAVSQIELNKYTEADEMLTTLSRGGSIYKNKAAWYLALSKLKQKDYKASIEVLKTIPKDADDYKNAQKLLKELD